MQTSQSQWISVSNDEKRSHRVYLHTKFRYEKTDTAPMSILLKWNAHVYAQFSLRVIEKEPRSVLNAIASAEHSVYVLCFKYRIANKNE